MKHVVLFRHKKSVIHEKWYISIENDTQNDGTKKHKHAPCLSISRLTKQAEEDEVVSFSLFSSFVPRRNSTHWVMVTAASYIFIIHWGSLWAASTAASRPRPFGSRGRLGRCSPRARFSTTGSRFLPPGTPAGTQTRTKHTQPIRKKII